MQLGGASGTSYSLANSAAAYGEAGMMPDVSQQAAADAFSITAAGAAQQAAAAAPLDAPR